MQNEETTHLNQSQQEAVVYDGGPLLIVAGAGTGKTTVITERIKWLIQEKKAKPEQILALTFTDKAAQEMEERVDIALPLGFNRTWIMTFHGFCERVLRQDIVQVGLDPGFEILSEAEMQLFMQDHLYEFDLDYFRPKGKPTKFLAGLATHFSRLKDEDVSVDEYSDFVTKHVPEDEIEAQKLRELAGAYRKYEDLKIKHSVFDFGDLISNTLKLLRDRPNVLKQYQSQFKYILLDEFQDTNYAQNHLAIMLAGDDHNITAVADDDQSIYRWRGAAVYNVLDFKKHFPKAKIVTLTQNYRSNQEILDHSYQLIQNNNPDRLEAKEKIDKKLVAMGVEPFVREHPINLIWKERGEDEADLVALEIKRLTEASNGQAIDCSNIAILVRANSHVEPFVQALRYYGIPYQFLGPGKLFRQPEIRDLMGYLKILHNITDSVALYKVLSMPVIGISGRDLNWLNAKARDHSTSVFELIETIIFQKFDGEINIGSESIEKLGWFVQLVYTHLEMVKHASTGQIVYSFLEKTGILQKMRDPQTELEMRQIENVRAFFEVIKRYEVRYPDRDLNAFVEYLEFLVDMGESPSVSEVDWNSHNAVSLLTIHAAKGLEFPVVFMVNLVDQRFPSRNRREQIPLPEEIIKEPQPQLDPHMSEERRLFYVGMTRAKECLYLTGAKFYTEGGLSSSTRRAKKISPFVNEALGDDLDRYQLGVVLPKGDPLAELGSFSLNQQIMQKEDSVSFNHKVDYLDYSRIETFQTCPLHYKLDYIVKVPKLPNAALVFGTVIHNTLRDLYQQIKIGNLAYDFDVDYEHALNYFEKNWVSIGYDSKKHEHDSFEVGKRILRDFLDRDLRKKNVVLEVETEFVFSVSPDLNVRGRIDRIDQLPDGTIEVIDYKTGQMPDENDLKNGSKGKGLQLSIYALAVTNPHLFDYSLDKARFSFYYLDAGEAITFEKTMEELGDAKEKIIEIRDEIERSNFECSGSYFCQQGCEYKLFC